MAESKLDETEAMVQRQVGHRSGQRVTLEHLRSLVVAKEWHRPNIAPDMTICTIMLKNGFVLTGESRPSDPKMFDSALGTQLSFDAAVAKIWPFEGYLLRDRLLELKKEDDAKPS